MNIKDIYHYIVGNIRYQLYYSKYFRFLMRSHIKEQIKVRIDSMDTVCYNNGSCKKCGCRTTHLQMANKACDKPCYPEMLSEVDWKILKEGFSYKGKGYTWQLTNTQRNRKSKFNKMKN